MIKSNLIYTIVILILIDLRINLVIGAEEDPAQNNVYSEAESSTKLSPKIKIYHNQDLKSFDVTSMRSYLRKFIIINNNNLKSAASKPKEFSFKKAVNSLRDLSMQANNSSYIVSFDQDTASFSGLNTKILVSGLNSDHHFNYMVVKPDFYYYHPVTQEYLGTVVINTANSSIIKRGELSLLKIDSFYEPVAIGMLVIPSKSLFLANKIKINNSVKNLNGYILSAFPDASSITYQNVVIISLGERDQVKVGNVLKILSKEHKIQDPYQLKKQYTYRPEDLKGEILVYDVFDKLSLGIVIKCSTDVEVLDQLIS